MKVSRRHTLSLVALGAALPSAGAIARGGHPGEGLIAAYLAAWRNKDLDGVLACMHPDVHFKAPNAETRGREAYRDATARFLSLVDRVQVRAQFAGGDQAMLAYDFVCRDPIGVSAVAELIKIDTGLIRETEIFFDTAPFAAFAAARKGKPS